MRLLAQLRGKLAPQPDEQATVAITTPKDAATAISCMHAFSTLCMKYDVSIVSTPGAHGTITVEGSPKRVRAFVTAATLAHGLGVI